MYEYLKRVIVVSSNVTTIYIHSWTSKGISNEQIKALSTSSSNDQEPILEYDGAEIRLKFTGDILMQNRDTYNHGPKVSIFIIYKLNSHTINNNFALKDCLFEETRITKDKDPDNYVYSHFGIGFDSTGPYTHSSGSLAHNVIIVGADSSQSIHNGNRLAGNVLILGNDLIQKINQQTVHADHTVPTSFTVTGKKFCLSLYYDGSISRLFVNDKRQIVFKAKDSEMIPYKMYLGNISTDFSATNA